MKGATDTSDYTHRWRLRSSFPVLISRREIWAAFNSFRMFGRSAEAQQEFWLMERKVGARLGVYEYRYVVDGEWHGEPEARSMKVARIASPILLARKTKSLKSSNHARCVAW